MANEKNLIPAKPGERRAAKPESQHGKLRSIRFADFEWAALQDEAKEQGRKRSEFIRSAAMDAIAQDMPEKVSHMYTWLLCEYMKSNHIDSLDDLFESDYEMEIYKVFSGDVPGTIRDAGTSAANIINKCD